MGVSQRRINYILVHINMYCGNETTYLLETGRKSIISQKEQMHQSRLTFFNIHTLLLKKGLDFPGGLVVKNLPVNAGNTGLISGMGGFHMVQGN